MGYLYFTRHGQTIWNVENKICGATDIALTELGCRQAEELGQKILDEKIKIDEILYSPLIRAARDRRIYLKGHWYSNEGRTASKGTEFWKI